MDIRMGAALVVLAAMVQSTVACGEEATEESVGKSEDNLDVACFKTAKTRAEFQACLGDVPQSGGGSTSSSGGGGSQSCSTSISCVNGVCKCGDGSVCEPSACSTQCKVCK